MSGLQAVGEAAKFLAYARNIPLRARIESMNVISTTTGHVILDIIWSAQFESAVALERPGAKKKVWRPNRATRRAVEREAKKG